MQAFKTIVGKDVRGIFASRSIWLPMLALPIAGSILLPLLMLYTAHSGFTGLATLEMLLKQAPADARLITSSQKLLFIGLNRIVPMIFLFIPILTTCNLGSVSIAGERQGKTLETLLYSPLGLRRLYLAKLAGTFGVAYAITLVCFFCFAATASAGTVFQYGSSYLVFPQWLALIFWLCPIMIALALGVIVWISARASSVQSAMQLSTLMVVPVFLLLVSQIAGTVALGPARILGLGAALVAAGAVLLWRVLAGLDAENLI